MQDRPNYQYYENNIIKETGQQGQGPKQNKKTNYKYYKGGSNKNNSNNLDEKVNINKNEHSQNYPHYRNRGNRKNYQDMNSTQNQNYKKKPKRKRDNNNEYQYQGNNTVEINQPTKEEFIEKQDNINISNGNNIIKIYMENNLKKIKIKICSIII